MLQPLYDVFDNTESRDVYAVNVYHRAIVTDLPVANLSLRWYVMQTRYKLCDIVPLEIHIFILQVVFKASSWQLRHYME